MPKMTTKEIVLRAGGNTTLGRELDLCPQAISLWIRKGRVPITHVPKVAKKSGVPAHEIRPDRPDLFPPPSRRNAA